MFHNFSVSSDFQGEFLDGSLAEPDAGPGVESFCFVAEKERRATGQGAELDARETRVFHALLFLEPLHHSRKLRIDKRQEVALSDAAATG